MAKIGIVGLGIMGQRITESFLQKGFAKKDWASINMLLEKEQ